MKLSARLPASMISIFGSYCTGKIVLCDSAVISAMSGDALQQGYSTSVTSGPNKKITGGVRAAQNIDQLMAKN